jgi:hypothetical protein
MNILLALAVQAAAQQAAPTISVVQRTLDAITDACHAPRSWLTHRGGNEVVLSASPDADYNMLSCVIDRLQKSTMPVSLSVLGNASASDNK